MPDNQKVTTRTRTLPRSYPGNMKYWYLDDLYLDSRGQADLSGTQKTVSEGHPVSLLGKTGDDIGGDFYTFKSEVVHVSAPSIYYNTGRRGHGWEYQGPVLPHGTAPMEEKHVDTILRSVHELNAMGGTAISRCSPVNSHSELLTSLSETLKDGLPAVPGISQWRERTRVAKGAGSEYLNAQFGWIPLINDIRDAVGAARDSAKILDQFKRDAGRVVRRRYDFPVERTTERIYSYEGPFADVTSSLGTYVWMPPFFEDGDTSGTSYTDREIKRKTWFTGAFTYHMPASDTQVGKFLSAVQQYDLLFGGVPTPDVLWNLTPWSWATDWFANTGDVLTNVSNAMLYGQVLRYGYLMEETTILDRNTLTMPRCKAGTRYESVVKTTVKRRIRASPFGFGINFDALDGYQLSILAALGLTWGRR